jgi:phosphoglycolate phosphatase
MKYKTLLFDLDGTISDPFEGISKSINYALESIGFDIVGSNQIRPMIGPPLNEIFESLSGNFEESVTTALIDKYRERYATIGYTENVIYDDIVRVIAALSGNGFNMGVCTSKRVDYATAIVEMFGLSSYFKFVNGGGDGIYKTQQIAALIDGGMRADSAIMIGDRRGDIDAAKQNGLRSVGVTWGFAEIGELAAAAPDFIVSSPAELLELFV